MKPRVRWSIAIVATAAYFGAHAWLGEIRGDHAWLAAGGLTAWLARGRIRTIARFFVPLVILGVVYDAQRYWADALRGEVRVAEPHAWEIAWFGIETGDRVITPAAWWQAHPHPALDAVTGAAYLLFIPGFLAFAAWWRFREKRPEADGVMWAMFWLNLAGYATYLIYPAAPPWYVDQYGLGPAILDAPPAAAGAARCDALFGVTWFAEFYARNTNVFGAIPSLHVGQTFLAALFAWRFGSLRIVATAFWAVMLFASVYLNHHYLVDGLVGMAFAVGAAAIAIRLHRLRSR